MLSTCIRTRTAGAWTAGAAAGVVAAALLAGAAPASAVAARAGHAVQAGTGRPEAPRAAAAWSSPAALWTAPAGWQAPSALRQVVDDAGVVTVAWTTRRGRSAAVYAARSQGAGWSAPVRVATAPVVPGLTVVSLRLAVGPGRRVVLAWFTSPATQPQTGAGVGAAVFTGSGWGAPTVLGRYPRDRLTAFGVVAHDAGVAVMWATARDLSSPATLRVADVAAGAAPAPVVLDAASAPLPAALLVRDGPGVRAVWATGRLGADVASAAGGAGTWTPAATVAPGASPDALSAAGGASGDVLVAWPQRGAGAVSVVAHGAAGWGPVTALPPVAAAATRVEGVHLAAGTPPTVTTRTWQTKDVVGTAHAYVLDGGAWTLLPPVATRPLYAGDLLLTLGARDDGTLFDPATRSWLESAAWDGAAWGAPRVVSGPATGRVDGWAGAPTTGRGYVVVFGRRPTATTSGVWAARLADGAWTAPEPVAPAARTGVRAFPATPVVAPDGTLTAAWTAGPAVRASRRG